MKQQINQSYPTREELAEVLDAHKKDGEAGILQFLQKQREKREQAESQSEQKEYGRSTLPPDQTS